MTSAVHVLSLTFCQQVLSTDIVMDVGDSLNPGIDIGQIEGGFIQGYGMLTMEDVQVSPQGFLHSRGPSTYKIPSFGDVPLEFNVTLLKDSPNPRGIYSAKVFIDLYFPGEFVIILAV